MIVLPPIVAGYATTLPAVVAGRGRRAARRRRRPRSARSTGAAAGAVFGAFVVFVDSFGVERVREVFLNISPVLMDYLLSRSHGDRDRRCCSPWCLGRRGRRRRRVPHPARSGVRRPLGTAVWVTLLFGFLQRIIPIALDQLDVERDWLYSKVTGGLTWVGAVVDRGRLGRAPRC